MTTTAAGGEEVGWFNGPGDLAPVADSLRRDGFVHLSGLWSGWAEAERDSLQIVAAAAATDVMGRALPELSPVGEFSAPPPGGIQRFYQALHIDFGLPIRQERQVDIARFTALHIEARQHHSGAATRIVGLEPLFRQREWPIREVIVERLGRSADPDNAVEGILGRIVEAVDNGTSLPPTNTPGYLCGMEFASQEEELSYFQFHGMDLARVERRIVLRSQEVLLIDNLRTGHGRLGRRNVNELHQLFVGYKALSPTDQKVLLDRILVAFSAV